MSDERVADLYRSSRAGLVRTATAMVGSVPVAEELVNEAFARLHTRIDTVEQPGPYVRRIVVNLALQHLRRRRLEQRPTPRTSDAVWPTDVDEMWVALGRLPAEQRVVLALRFYEDLSEASIAVLLDCPVGTVKSRVHRGLERLRKELS